ncbi:MAG: hypothetical protein V4516_02990, partial [Pseudomonadota bacterium]
MTCGGCVRSVTKAI